MRRFPAVEYGSYFEKSEITILEFPGEGLSLCSWMERIFRNGASKNCRAANWYCSTLGTSSRSIGVRASTM